MCVEGWIDGWMEGWVDGWMEGRNLFFFLPILYLALWLLCRLEGRQYGV